MEEIIILHKLQKCSKLVKVVEPRSEIRESKYCTNSQHVKMIHESSKYKAFVMLLTRYTINHMQILHTEWAQNWNEEMQKRFIGFNKWPSVYRNVEMFIHFYECTKHAKCFIKPKDCAKQCSINIHMTHGIRATHAHRWNKRLKNLHKVQIVSTMQSDWYSINITEKNNNKWMVYEKHTGKV